MEFPCAIKKRHSMEEWAEETENMSQVPGKSIKNQ